MKSEDALANAVRILENAEGETDRSLMELMLSVADRWIEVARIQAALEGADV